MYKAVIIDDLEQARQTLRKDLAAYCKEVEVIGEAGGVVEGAKLLRKLKPDVLFLDIQMPDGSGFDLLELLDEIKFKIIFITASDAYAIKAFRFSAVDYLLKPIDPDELKASVEKLGELRPAGKENVELLLNNIREKGKKHNRLALHTQDKIHIVNISDIVRCEANVNYTEFYFNGGKKLLVTKTLKDFDEMLSDNGFFRVHQSHLVNTHYIKEFIKGDGGYLIMTDGSNVPVSSRKRAEVVKMLEEL
ncbi:MAG TPA: LytTR family DNA-binding domain-containing protein [Bacteroidia bacterium]|jgi:two-component system LytT family response regulator